MIRLPLYALVLASIATSARADDAVEFCLDGEFDLGARYQGTHPASGEFFPARWCVTTESDSQRALFSASGHFNPDMSGDFSVAFLPPDLVRIVNRNSPPDIEFHGADSLNEALRNRRIDPLRLVEEVEAHPEWVTKQTADGWMTIEYPGAPATIEIRTADGCLKTLRSSTDLPLRGRVPVFWRWNWEDRDAPQVIIEVDGDVIFKAQGSWRELGDDERSMLWQATPGKDPVKVPGEFWPARVNMQLDKLAASVYIVRNVRTGFHHLVIDTDAGLVVADAPAGWVEIQQIPPEDLVPGLSISGLSERFIDFLYEQFPDRPIRAVALTHLHDDHAGGARAFAAAGADIYAPAEISDFLQTVLNKDAMPADRLHEIAGTATVKPVSEPLTLADATNPVQLLPIGPGPHTAASLGLYAVDQGFFFQSDLHVPNSDADEPRAERAATECWFAAWAVEHLPPETIVINTHSTVQTPVSRLAVYLDSDLCD